jgi:hypothetical protein
VPGDFEGKVPEAMFTQQHLVTHPVMIGTTTNRRAKDDETASMAEEEKEKIMAQLQMLGYME